MSIEKEYLANESGVDYDSVMSDNELSKKDFIVKENWVMPECNIEDYKPVAFFYKNGIIELDFLSEEKAVFLSEYDDLSIEIDYPFVEGYKPTIQDYEALGFTVLNE